MYLIIFSIVKKRMEAYGVVQSTHLAKLYKIINHCFQGLRKPLFMKRKKSTMMIFPI